MNNSERQDMSDDKDFDRWYDANEHRYRVIGAKPWARVGWMEAAVQAAKRFNEMLVQQREARATHKCVMCDALWIDNSVFGDGDMWSLASEDCGKCCDNDRMDRPNIIKMPWYERLTSD